MDVLIDVGGEYSPSTNRFDHHQRGFEEIFGNGHVIKLSSAGLVYKHFGLEIIAGANGQMRACKCTHLQHGKPGSQRGLRACIVCESAQTVSVQACASRHARSHVHLCT
jgi:hypothetical protein